MVAESCALLIDIGYIVNTNVVNISYNINAEPFIHCIIELMLQDSRYFSLTVYFRHWIPSMFAFLCAF